MDHRITTQGMHRFKDQRNVFVALLVLSLVVNILQGVERVMVSEKTIVLPPDIKQGVWLSKKEISPSYLEEWAMYLSSLALTRTPSSSSYKKDLFLRHVSPESYADLKAFLEKEGDFLAKNQASVCFNPKTVEVQSDALTATVLGTHITYVGKEKVSEHPMNIHFTFQMTPDQNLLVTQFQPLEEGKNPNDHE